MGHDPGDAGADQVSQRRAIGVGCGLAVVAFAYGPSSFGDTARLWAAVTTVIVALLLVDGVTTLRALLPVPGAVGATFGATLVAAALCVPETDQLPVAAIVPVGVVVAEVVLRRQLGLEWYALAVTSVGWAAMVGATGRQSALVGALFAWWAVGLVPLVHRVHPLRTRGAAASCALVGALAAMVYARTGGVATEAPTAWITLAVVAPASFAIGLGVVRFWPVGDRVAG